jgi:ribosome-binding protein aMBF1 (putative translation factor)
MGRRTYRELADATMKPDTRARAKAKTAELLKALPLTELRRAREMSQANLAMILETTQSEISKIEHRTDMYVSTLRSYIVAMGGELEIVARFPDGDVKIDQFAEKDDDRGLAHA